MRGDVVDLLREGVEVDIGVRRERGPIGSGGSFGGARKDFEMIVAEWTHAHDLDVTIGFDGQLGLDAEDDFDSLRILRIDAEALDTSDFGTTGIANLGAGLQAARERKKSMVGFRGAAKSAADAENRGEQNASGNQDKQSDEGLFTFTLHKGPL